MTAIDSDLVKWLPLGTKRGCTTGIAKDVVKQSNAIELVFMGPEVSMVNAAGKQQRTAYT